jgi:hypothetical protein
MAKITNTLTRLHKIAERIAQRRQQVAEAIQQGVAPEQLDAAVLAVRGAALTEKARFAIDESLAQHDELASAYVAVRNALAAANVQAGVSKVLAEQESLKRRITLLTAETKRIGCPSGHLTIRNTMIKIGGARYVKVHF